MDDVLQVSIEDLVVVRIVEFDRMAPELVPFGQIRYQHDQSCKFGRTIQLYIWYLVLIFLNKNVLHNLIYYLM